MVDLRVTTNTGGEAALDDAVWVREVRPFGYAEKQVRFDEFVPSQPEHQANGVTVSEE